MSPGHATLNRVNHGCISPVAIRGDDIIVLLRHGRSSGVVVCLPVNVLVLCLIPERDVVVTVTSWLVNGANLLRRLLDRNRYLIEVVSQPSVDLALLLFTGSPCHDFINARNFIRRPLVGAQPCAMWRYIILPPTHRVAVTGGRDEISSRLDACPHCGRTIFEAPLNGMCGRVSISIPDGDQNPWTLGMHCDRRGGQPVLTRATAAA